MKYIVSRTSDYNEVNSPCEGAVKEQLFISSAAYDFELNRSLNEILKDYDYAKKEGDEIYLYKLQDVWVVDIPDLLEFVKKYGEVILGFYHNNDQDLPKVEIYDDYRE